MILIFSFSFPRDIWRESFGMRLHYFHSVYFTLSFKKVARGRSAFTFLQFPTLSLPFFSFIKRVWTTQPQKVEVAIVILFFLRSRSLVKEIIFWCRTTNTSLNADARRGILNHLQILNPIRYHPISEFINDAQFYLNKPRIEKLHLLNTFESTKHLELRSKKPES